MENNKLWCIGICPEDDSTHEQSPAASKEIAERALARYRAMMSIFRFKSGKVQPKNTRNKCFIQKTGLKNRCTSAKTCSRLNKLLSTVKSCTATKMVLS